MADDVTKINVASTSLNPSIAPDVALDEENGPFADVQKELATRFELLPEDLKKVIVDDNYQIKLFDIGKANKLNYEELGALEMETTMVLLGMIRPTEYRDELQIQLKKNDAELDVIVKAVDEQVFLPIRASLEKLYANKKEPEDFLNPAPAATAPTTAPVSTPTPMASARITPTPGFGTFPTVPTAPVAPKPAPTLSTSEKSMLEKTGVVISETPAPAPVAPMSSRSDLLQSIENPTKKPAAPMAAPVATPTFVDRLKSAAPTMPATKTTDYSIVKPPAATPVPTPGTSGARLIDPYREKID